MLKELQLLLNTLYTNVPVNTSKLLQASDRIFCVNNKVAVFNHLDNVAQEEGELLIKTINILPLNPSYFKLGLHVSSEL